MAEHALGRTGVLGQPAPGLGCARRIARVPNEGPGSHAVLPDASGGGRGLRVSGHGRPLTARARDARHGSGGVPGRHQGTLRRLPLRRCARDRPRRWGGRRRRALHRRRALGHEAPPFGAATSAPAGDGRGSAKRSGGDREDPRRRTGPGPASSGRPRPGRSAGWPRAPQSLRAGGRVGTGIRVRGLVHRGPRHLR